MDRRKPSLLRPRTGHGLFKIAEQELDREEHEPDERSHETPSLDGEHSRLSGEEQLSSERGNDHFSDLDQSFHKVSKALARSLKKANSSFSLSVKSTSSDKESGGSSLSSSVIENERFQDLLFDDSEKLCSQLLTEASLFSPGLVERILTALRGCLPLGQAIFLVLDELKDCEQPFALHPRWAEVDALFDRWQLNFVFCFEYVLAPFAFVLVILLKYYRGDSSLIGCLDDFVCNRYMEILVIPQLFQFISQFLGRESQVEGILLPVIHQLKNIQRALTKGWREIQGGSEFKVLRHYEPQEMDVIDKKYLEEDQLLKDSSEELASLLFQVETRMFLNLTLSSCFESRAGPRTKLDAERLDLFNLWLASLILRKLASGERPEAKQYIAKVFELAELCYSSRKNMPSLIGLFYVMVFVSLNLKSLWEKVPPLRKEQFKLYEKLFYFDEDHKLPQIEVPLMYRYFKKLIYKETVHAKEGFERLSLGVSIVARDILSTQRRLREFRERQKNKRMNRLDELVFRYYYEELYLRMKRKYPDVESRKQGLEQLAEQAKLY